MRTKRTPRLPVIHDTGIQLAAEDSKAMQQELQLRTLRSESMKQYFRNMLQAEADEIRRNPPEEPPDA